jgi:hypothetical protein
MYMHVCVYMCACIHLHKYMYLRHTDSVGEPVRPVKVTKVSMVMTRFEMTRMVIHVDVPALRELSDTSESRNPAFSVK